MERAGCGGLKVRIPGCPERLGSSGFQALDFWDKFLVRKEDQELGCLGSWGWLFGISRAKVSWSLASLVQIRASPCSGRCWPSPY